MYSVDNIVVNSVKQQAQVYTACTILLAIHKFPKFPQMFRNPEKSLELSIL